MNLTLKGMRLAKGVENLSCSLDRVHGGDNKIKNIRINLMHDIVHDGQCGLKNLVSDGAPSDDVMQMLTLKIENVMGMFLRIGRKNVEEFSLGSQNRSGFFFF